LSTLLFTDGSGATRHVEVHALGPHRIRIIATKHDDQETCVLKWSLWQYGWNKVSAWGDRELRSPEASVDHWREEILKEATMFIDGLENTGPN
jgi:hypothetical protein